MLSNLQFRQPSKRSLNLLRLDLLALPRNSRDVLLILIRLRHHLDLLYVRTTVQHEAVTRTRDPVSASFGMAL